MVKFNNVEKKNEFVRAAKSKKISTVMYGYGGEPLPIYVDPQLTRDSFTLFKYAKKLKKVGIAFVWISANGEILVREKPTSNIINIKTTAQIDAIERECILRTNHLNANEACANSKHNGDNVLDKAKAKNAKRAHTTDRDNTATTLPRNTTTRAVNGSNGHNSTKRNDRNATHTHAMTAANVAVSLQLKTNTSGNVDATHSAPVPASGARTSSTRTSSKEENPVGVEVSNIKGINRLLVVGVYRPPNGRNYGEMIKTIDNLLNGRRVKHTLVCGDLNINVKALNNSTDNGLRVKYLNYLSKNGLKLCNGNVTREASGTIIDHILSNMTLEFQHHVDTVKNSFSDHNIVITRIDSTAGRMNDNDLIVKKKLNLRN